MGVTTSEAGDSGMAVSVFDLSTASGVAGVDVTVASGTGGVFISGAGRVDVGDISESPPFGTVWEDDGDEGDEQEISVREVIRESIKNLTIMKRIIDKTMYRLCIMCQPGKR